MQGFVDLEDYVTDWAWTMLDAVKIKIPKENLYLDISWKRVKFKHSEPDYSDTHIPAEPKGQVVFTTTYVNDSEEEHAYSFRTERTTRSSCEVEMYRGVTTATEMSLSLKTPCEVFEANAGFSREVEVSKSEGETIEREMVWSVDSQIKLPHKTKTLAKLVVNQQEYSGKFKITTKFWGRVVITVHNRKDNNNYVRTLDGFVEEIFRNKEGFKIDKKVVSYVSEGKCHFRYGIDQQVKLQQLALDKNDILD